MMIQSLPRRRRPLNYSILVEPRPDGTVIGSYAGADIHASVVDAFGRRYVYAGAAPRRLDGSLDDGALKAGEFFVLPGLVYRLAARKAA